MTYAEGTAGGISQAVGTHRWVDPPLQRLYVLYMRASRIASL